MKLSVIGCGYLGAVHAAAMASIGHDVVGIDVDERKIATLSQGEAPVLRARPARDPRGGHRVGPPALHHRHGRGARRRRALRRRRHPAAEGRLRRRPDLRRRGRSTDSLPYLRPGDIVAGKSTVPVGTAARSRRARRPRPARRSCGTPSSSARAGRSRTPIDPDRLVAGVPRRRRGRARRRHPARGLPPRRSRRARRSSSPTTRPPSSSRSRRTPSSRRRSRSSTRWPRSPRSPAPTSRSSPTRSATTPASAAASSAPASASAAAACRRTSARSRPAPRNSAAASRSPSCARSTRSTSAAANAPSSSWSRRSTAVVFKKNDHRARRGVQAAQRRHPRLPRARRRGAAARASAPGSPSPTPPRSTNAARLHPQLDYVEDRDEALRGADAVIVVTEWDEYRRELDPAHAASLVDGRDRRRRPQLPGCRRLARGRVDLLRHGPTLSRCGSG